MMQTQGMFFDDNCVIMYENRSPITRNFFLLQSGITPKKKSHKPLLEYTDLDLKTGIFGRIRPYILMQEIDFVQWGGGKLAM